MAEWQLGSTAAPSSPYNSSFAYYADLGPYTGPLPSAPPIPANLPALAQEIDYVIGIPDPSAASGFQGDRYLDVNRYWTGTPGDLTQMATGWFDLAGLPPASPANHIVVVWWLINSTDPVPPVAPETLCPPSFAVAGRGAAVGDPSTGHWSSTISGLTEQQAAHFSSVSNLEIGVSPGFDSYHYASPGAAQVAGIASVAACPDSSAFPSTPGGGEQNSFFGVELVYSGGSLLWSIWTLAQPYRQYRMALNSAATLPVGDLPTLITPSYPVLANLIEGLDYWTLPGHNYGDAYQYSDFLGAPAQADFTTYDPITIEITPGAGIGGTVTVAYTDLIFNLEAVPSVLDLTSDHIVQDGEGTLLGTITAVLGGANPPVSLTVSPLSRHDQTLVLRVPDVAGIAPPIATAAADGTQQVAGWNLTIDSISAFNAHYLINPFRYWVPGPARSRSEAPLRQVQRDDGLGIAGHPRIRTARNHPTSEQLVTAPRIFGGGTLYR